MIILGINTYHSDASAALLRDGELVAAVEEERFTRVKHTGGFPYHAIRYCLEAGRVNPEEIDHIVIARKRTAHLLQKAFWALRSPHMVKGRARVWRRFSGVWEEVASCLGVPESRLRARCHFIEHHVAHAASTFYSSPFKEAAVLSIDALGDFASLLWGVGKDRDLRLNGFVLFPHSIGLYYTAITQYLGFWKFGDEYKVMGLGAYGEPEYKEVFEDLIRVGRGMKFNLGLRYFTHPQHGVDINTEASEPKVGRLYSEYLEQALGPAREPGGPVEKRHEDLAATLQWRLEEVLFPLITRLHDKTQMSNLCYAGGVAFNCVANGMIFDRTPFEEMYIQPAAGDSGLAVGAALYVYHQVLGHPRKFTMPHAYWGPEYPADRIREVLDRYGLSYRTLDGPALVEETAARIAEGKVVGWFQGRAEWGPRALGNRSIVVDPRRPDMKDILNERIKRREPFRPFAPSILEERTGEWFEKDYPSPFMLMAYPVRSEKRSQIPAPTHVDGTGRLQTVSRDSNPLYWELIHAFEKLTGVPTVLNTSFNENEPIVNTPEEAVECFLRTRMDTLVVGDFVAEKAS